MLQTKARETLSLNFAIITAQRKEDPPVEGAFGVFPRERSHGTHLGKNWKIIDLKVRFLRSRICDRSQEARINPKRLKAGSPDWTFHIFSFFSKFGSSLNFEVLIFSWGSAVKKHFKGVAMIASGTEKKMFRLWRTASQMSAWRNAN